MARRARGFSLLEIVIALALSLTLVGACFGVLQRCRGLFAGGESVAQVNDAARHALAVLVADIEHAGFFGFAPPARVELLRDGVVVAADAALRQPTPELAVPRVDLPAGAHDCGVNFAVDIRRPAQGTDNGYALGEHCEPTASAGGARAGSDTLTVRHASLALAVPRPGRLQVYSAADMSTPLRLLADGRAPARDDTHELRDLEVRSYYVANNSVGRPGLPALRVKALTESGGDIQFRDEEVMPGVEDLQVELGVVSSDGALPDYVTPDSPRARLERVVAVRVWLRVRAETPAAGMHDAGAWTYSNVSFTPVGDERRYRRLLVTRTVALRNAAP